MTAALRRNRYRVLAALDNDPVACRTYKLNHPSTRLLQKDIRKVEPSRIKGLSSIKQLDLLIVCAPCQPFSSQNRNRQGDERAELLLESVKFARVLNPSIILFENVSGLAGVGNQQILTKLNDGLKELGYYLSEPRRIDAADLGVPQRRVRCVMIATKRKQALTEFETADFSAPKQTVKQAIGGLAKLESGEKSMTDPLHFARDHQQIVLDRLRHISKDGGSRSDLPAHLELKCHRGKPTSYSDVYGRMNWNGVAPTLTTGCTDLTRGRFAHPEQDRAITLREAALLTNLPGRLSLLWKRGRYRATNRKRRPRNDGRSVASYLRENDAGRSLMARIKVRARAVDMLGRQQIAGIPTAIHELFKNAHDAYADRVEVDYFRADRLVVLRDDGVGMTRSDFEDRWLTLGTESKVGANAPGAQNWTGPRGKPARPIMGEKGIGRLAIAAIGPQVLVLTRAVRPDGLHPLVAALVNWRFFEVPGLELDSIDIPILEVEDGDLPSRELLASLIDRVRANVDLLEDRMFSGQAEAIRSDLELINIDLADLQGHLSEPRLGPSEKGTHFYILPSAAILSDDINAGDDDAASPLEKMLLGFSNTMMPDRGDPLIRAQFRDHREDGRVGELIGGEAFFTPDEFVAADHHIDGVFDHYGQFSGSVGVYDQAAVEHVIPWPKSSGRPTDCGPFRIRFAYLQGRMTESRLPPDEFGRISRKLNRIGGLYVYRDGIRILPYGNSDFDFLNIERRRTKSAQDWFFSYRRIFGAVEISHTSNQNLVEKAGREGFRTNKAYRELSAILENFFERLAIDFFRPTSTFGDDFNSIKQELTREAKALERREKRVKERRRKFSDQLVRFFDAVERSEPSGLAQSIVADLALSVEALGMIKDTELAAERLLELETEVRTAAANLRERYTIIRPRGFGMTKPQQRDWAAYLRNYDKLDAEVFGPLERSIDDLITQAASGPLASVDRRRRVMAGLESKRRTATTTSSRLRREVGVQVKELSGAVDATLRDCVTRLGDDIARTFADLGRTDTASVDSEALRELQQTWEHRIDVSASETRERLEALRDQLESVAEAVVRNELPDETTAALETQSEGYRAQLDDYAELAQVGMALGIVQHEFQSTANTINDSLAKLQPWGRANSDLDKLVRDVRGGFEHLEGYLRLFTPMSRRLNRDVIELTGEQIRIYIDEVFGDRIARHHIDLKWTRRFDSMRVRGYTSTFLPAFVNVVDNALFWITFDRDAERWIEFDADDDAFLVTNGGPGIEHRIAERIFEFGETTKPNGRGMGLYISRQALNKEGYDLTLEAVGRDIHPTFRIGPRPEVADAETDPGEAEND